MATFTLRPIGFIRSPYTNTKEIPKGFGAKHDVEGVLEIEPEFESGLMDTEGFSHFYVIWVFHNRSDGYVDVVSPPTDDRPHGVFATRSPTRPNPIGLTVVELLGRDGRKLRIKGLDMLDGTPVLDIKPYMSSLAPDSLKLGWYGEAQARREKK